MKKLTLLVLLLLVGCAATPSPELAYWKCLEREHSYVKCADKEVVR